MAILNMSDKKEGSAHATVTPEGRRVTITTYKLIKTPDNEHGDVVGG